jgi:hypothetical protein
MNAITLKEGRPHARTSAHCQPARYPTLQTGVSDRTNSGPHPLQAGRPSPRAHFGQRELPRADNARLSSS